MKQRRDNDNNTNGFRLPASILANIGKLLSKADSHAIQHLRNSLESDPYIISHKFYENVDGYRKYCIITLLAKVNSEEFAGKSDLEKVRAAHKLAIKLRDIVIEHKHNRAFEIRGEPMFFEEYLKDRYTRYKQNKMEGSFLAKTEVCEIIDLCDNILKKRNYINTESVNTSLAA